MIENHGTGSNYIVEALDRAINDISISGRLDPTLFLQLENAPEKKQQIRFVLFGILGSSGCFRQDRGRFPTTWSHPHRN